MSDTALKDSNRWRIFTVILVNILVFYFAIKTDALFSADWAALFASMKEGIPASFLLILSGIANAQLSRDMKARIVFFRWDDPMPGSRAFSHYIHADSRIDPVALERKLGQFPSDPKKQNSLWYKLYQSVEANPAVQQAHREYLFTRDYNSLSLLMIVILGGAGFIQIPSVETAGLYAVLLVAQFWFTGQAARDHGKSFVTTVLAQYAAKD